MPLPEGTWGLEIAEESLSLPAQSQSLYFLAASQVPRS